MRGQNGKNLWTVVTGKFTGVAIRHFFSALMTVSFIMQ